MVSKIALWCSTASLCLPAQAALAQGIFKQADAEGRVIITDNPDPALRTLQRYAPGSPGGAPAAVIAQKPGAAAPNGGLQPSSGHPGDEVQLALDTYTTMSSPRSAAIDAREAARRAHAAPARNPLRFNDVQFQPPRLRPYEARKPQKTAAAALPALNWTAGGGLGLVLAALWSAAYLLLQPAARRRLLGYMSAAQLRVQGWMTRLSGTA